MLELFSQIVLLCCHPKHQYFASNLADKAVPPSATEITTKGTGFLYLTKPEL